MEIKVDEIRELVAEIIEVESEEILMETKFMEDLNADSLMALEILARLEKIYKIKIPEDSLKIMTNLENVIQVLKDITGLEAS